MLAVAGPCACLRPSLASPLYAQALTSTFCSPSPSRRAVACSLLAQAETAPPKRSKAQTRALERQAAAAAGRPARQGAAAVPRLEHQAAAESRALERLEMAATLGQEQRAMAAALARASAPRACSAAIHCQAQRSLLASSRTTRGMSRSSLRSISALCLHSLISRGSQRSSAQSSTSCLSESQRRRSPLTRPKVRSARPCSRRSPRRPRTS